MMKKGSKTTKRSQQPAQAPARMCDCTDCHWAQLVQYEGPQEPLLAECTKKPQPYSDKFPYQVEVARAMKLCPMHLHTDVVKIPQVRAKVRHHPQACYVLSQSQKEAV